MANKSFAKLTLKLLDSITNIHPSFAPKIFQKIFLKVFGSDFACMLSLRSYIRKLKTIKDFSRILIVVDVNIGDSILIQQSVRVLRFYFPDSEIDYACNQIGGELIGKTLGADRVYNVFTGNGKPSASDNDVLKSIVSTYDYSVILNLSHFIETREISKSVKIIDLYLPFGIFILNLRSSGSGQLHISAALHAFLHRLFNRFLYKKIPNSRNDEQVHEFVPVFAGNSVSINDKSVEEAKFFLFRNNIFPGERLLFCNPDASSELTQIGAKTYSNIITDLLESKEISYVLLAAAYRFEDIENRIFKLIPTSHRKKVIIVPHVSLTIFTALIDYCDVFLSGDCSPLHIAASMRLNDSRIHGPKNETAVVSIFGSADSRMYGYDSFKSGYIAANQNAPSKAFSSKSHCTNLTCTNQWNETCKDLHCHLGYNTFEISSYIVSYLKSSRKKYSKAA